MRQQYPHAAAQMQLHATQAAAAAARSNGGTAASEVAQQQVLASRPPLVSQLPSCKIVHGTVHAMQCPARFRSRLLSHSICPYETMHEAWSCLRLCRLHLTQLPESCSNRCCMLDLIADSGRAAGHSSSAWFY